MDIKVNQYTVIVFDLDDTLYNEMAYLRSAYKEIAKELSPKNWQGLFARMYSLFRSKQDVFEFLISQYDVQKVDLLQTYRAHQPSLYLFEGAMEIIQKIKEKHGKIGIITDGRTSTQTVKIKALGIYEIIDKIVISEEVGSEKPNKKNFQIIENTFPNCSYLYMADNLRKDFISPNELGWKTLGLADNGLNMHYDGHLYFDENHKPQAFVSSFTEINVL